MSTYQIIKGFKDFKGLKENHITPITLISPIALIGFIGVIGGIGLITDNYSPKMVLHDNSAAAASGRHERW